MAGHAAKDVTQAVGISDVRQPLHIAVVVVVDNPRGGLGAFGNVCQKPAAAKGVKDCPIRTIAGNMRV